MKLYFILFLMTVYIFKNAKANPSTEEIIENLEKTISVFNNMKADTVGILIDELVKVHGQVSELETKYKKKGDALYKEILTKLTKFFNSKEFSAEESEEKTQRSNEVVSTARTQFHKCLKKPCDSTRKILKKDIESLKSMIKYIATLRSDVEACAAKKHPRGCYIDLLRNVQSMRNNIFENLIEINQNAVEDFNVLPTTLQNCVDIMVATVLKEAPELLKAVYQDRMNSD